MNALNTEIREPQQSGNSILKLIAALALLAGGFRIGYCTDTDWDRDGVPNTVEMKCNMDPRHTDSDRDGVKDGRESFKLYYGTPTPSYDDLSTDKVCLTSLDERKEVCFHPSEILLFEITQDGRYLAYDWQGDAQYVQENLDKIDGIIRGIGYTHFYRVNRQNLANLLLAECLNSDTLYLTKEENLWCHVSREKLRSVLEQIGNCR